MKNSLLEIYKYMYSLNNINTKFVSKEETISFVFYDNDGYYTLENGSILSYASVLSNNVLYFIKDIEIKYNIKIINYFPLCFTGKNGIIISCKIDKQNEKLTECSSLKEYKELINLIKKQEMFYSDDYADEILLVEKYHKRYEFYRKYIKKYILTEKKRKKKEFLDFIGSMIPKNTKSIIDVSCGDNEDIFKVSKNVPYVVGNDINLYQIKKVNNNYNNALFTNNNLLNLPFKEKIFDISYCKNTLHHLGGKEELNKVFDYLLKISNKIIIIEIEDPKRVGGFSKFLNNNLYIKYLKDAGKNFLSLEEFKEIIDMCFKKDCNIKYKSFENILGKYMIAEIEKR